MGTRAFADSRAEVGVAWGLPDLWLMSQEDHERTL